MNNLLKEAGFENLNNIPPHCKRLYIDVGTSIDAPNSASWLLMDPEAYVIGIEPHQGNIDTLTKGRDPNFHLNYLCLGENSVKRNGYKLGEIGGRFCMLHCAIDDVEESTTVPFYHTDSRNTGCSSLLVPTKKLGLDVVNVVDTPVVSLKMIMDHIPKNRFEVITFLKTDTQGKDLDVVKSLGDYINKVILLQMEVFTNNQYRNEQKKEDIEEFLAKHKFQFLIKGTYDWMLSKGNITPSEFAKYVPKDFEFIEGT
jgi:hypothetical protein